MGGAMSGAKSRVPVDAALLRAARAEFVGTVLPGLDGPARYTGAMLKRALDVLIAQATAAEAPEAALERAGFGSADALAGALRARAAGEAPALPAALRAYVDARLAIANPQFLADRRAARGDQRR